MVFSFSNLLSSSFRCSYQRFLSTWLLQIKFRIDSLSFTFDFYVIVFASLAIPLFMLIEAFNRLSGSELFSLAYIINAFLLIILLLISFSASLS